jgi:hypothetical protein
MAESFYRQNFTLPVGYARTSSYFLTMAKLTTSFSHKISAKNNPVNLN